MITKNRINELIKQKKEKLNTYIIKSFVCIAYPTGRGNTDQTPMLLL